MKSCLKYLKGKQDYSCFQSSGCQAQTSIRNVQSLSLEKNKNIITFTITANAFLYHMVRNIVGMLVDVGLGKLKPKQVKMIIQKRDRSFSSKMAPAHGLFLWRVAYPQIFKIKYNRESILL